MNLSGSADDNSFGLFRKNGEAVRITANAVELPNDEGRMTNRQRMTKDYLGITMQTLKCFWEKETMSAALETVINSEKEYEVVNGQPEEKVMGGALHGGVGLRLGSKLWVHVEANHLGGVYGPDTTFQIGENQRLPDIAFVAAVRIPEEGEPEGIWPIAPDLAIEIISPTDLYEKVMTKVNDYMAAGVRQVWLVSLEHRMITVYSSLTDVNILQEEAELDGGDVLPGFRFRVGELFQSPARSSK